MMSVTVIYAIPCILFYGGIAYSVSIHGKDLKGTSYHLIKLGFFIDVPVYLFNLGTVYLMNHSVLSNFYLSLNDIPYLLMAIVYLTSALQFAQNLRCVIAAINRMHAIYKPKRGEKWDKHVRYIFLSIPVLAMIFASFTLFVGPSIVQKDGYINWEFSNLEILAGGTIGFSLLFIVATIVPHIIGSRLLKTSSRSTIPPNIGMPVVVVAILEVFTLLIVIIASVCHLFHYESVSFYMDRYIVPVVRDVYTFSTPFCNILLNEELRQKISPFGKNKVNSNAPMVTTQPTTPPGSPFLRIEHGATQPPSKCFLFGTFS